MNDSLPSNECVLEIVKEGDRWALNLLREDGSPAWTLATSPLPITVRHAHEPAQPSSKVLVVALREIRDMSCGCEECTTWTCPSCIAREALRASDEPPAIPATITSEPACGGAAVNIVRAVLADVQRDAERYRFLREHSQKPKEVCVTFNIGHAWVDADGADQFDEWIDHIHAIHNDKCSEAGEASKFEAGSPCRVREASASYFDGRQTLCPVCKINWIGGDEKCDH